MVIRSQAFAREPRCVACSVIDVRIVRLERRSKKRFAAVVGWSGAGGTIGGYVGFATCRARDFGLFWNSKCDASRVAVVAQ